MKRPKLKHNRLKAFEELIAARVLVGDWQGVLDLEGCRLLMEKFKKHPADFSRSWADGLRMPQPVPAKFNNLEMLPAHYRK